MCYDSDMKHHYKKGFTLAETLITLAIVGVVAAVIMPAVISAYSEKVLINQLQVAYNIVLNSTMRLMNDEQVVSVKQFAETPEESFLVYQNKLRNYLNVVKICQANSMWANACNTEKIALFNENSGSFIVDNYDVISRLGTFVLDNGMKIMFKEGSGKCSLKSNFTYDDAYNGSGGGTYGWACGAFYIDVNGNKAPNTVGKDIFLFYLVQDGVIPAGLKQESIWTQQFSSRGEYKYSNVAAWVLYNKNMDYLKCSGLSWEGAHSCK